MDSPLTRFKYLYKQELQTGATALMFMTRLPVGGYGSGCPAVLARATVYFPVIGLLIGVLMAGFASVIASLWSAEVVATLVVIAAIICTGAFHEDGLADVADSFGAWDRDRKLEVMRDSRVGTYGSVALVMCLVLSVYCLAAVLQHGGAGILSAMLICGHVLGRWSSLPLIFFTPYAREDSANKVIAEGVTLVRLAMGTLLMLLSLLPALILGAHPGTVALALTVTAVIVLLSHWWYRRCIGGITGDCLGASNKICEVVCYLVFAAAAT